MTNSLTTRSSDMGTIAHVSHVQLVVTNRLGTCVRLLFESINSEAVFSHMPPSALERCHQLLLRSFHTARCSKQHCRLHETLQYALSCTRRWCVSLHPFTAPVSATVVSADISRFVSLSSLRLSCFVAGLKASESSHLLFRLRLCFVHLCRLLRSKRRSALRRSLPLRCHLCTCSLRATVRLQSSAPHVDDCIVRTTVSSVQASTSQTFVVQCHVAMSLQCASFVEFPLLIVARSSDNHHLLRMVYRKCRCARRWRLCYCHADVQCLQVLQLVA